MIQIEDHTVEEKIIQKNGWVLDLGCIIPDNVFYYLSLYNVIFYCKNITLLYFLQFRK